MTDRYSTVGSAEGEYQPGSDDEVLRNKLGIITVAEMDQVELELLDLLYENVISTVASDQVITVDSLVEWHRKWLGNVYEWAGCQRSVNMGKGGFNFAAAAQIPRLLSELEQKFLSIFTPCEGMDEDQLTEAITVVHIEFILVHPFREGNGRLLRLLANVMALQAGWPELDFSVLDKNKEQYFASIQAGMECDYEPLSRLIRQVLRDSENAFSG